MIPCFFGECTAADYSAFLVAIIFTAIIVQKFVDWRAGK